MDCGSGFCHLPSLNEWTCDHWPERGSRFPVEHRAKAEKHQHSAVVVNYRFVRSGAPPRGSGAYLLGPVVPLITASMECETQIDPRDRLCQLVFAQQMENGPNHVQ